MCVKKVINAHKAQHSKLYVTLEPISPIDSKVIASTVQLVITAPIPVWLSLFCVLPVPFVHQLEPSPLLYAQYISILL
jgi:hypothetical protein